MREARRPGRAAFRKRLIAVCGAWLVLAALIGVVPEAHAGMVYGQVNLAGQPFPKGEAFVLEGEAGSARVATDEAGNYRVFLAPGRYMARYRDNAGRNWEASVESYPGPLRQDVVFQRR